MGRNIDEILESMDELLDNSPGVPFSGKKVMVDVEKMRELIGDVRLNLPQEIKNAINIVKDRQKILDEAKAIAEDTVRKAEERAKAIVGNDEIVKSAKDKADEIMRQTSMREMEMRKATNEYIDKILAATDESLTSNLTEIRKLRQAARSAAKGISKQVQKPDGESNQ